MRKLAICTIIFSLFLALLANGVAWADPWAVVTNHSDRTINTIDLATDPLTVYGPFLEDELGTSGSLLDVSVTPDGQYALVCNFDQGTVYRVDLQDPADPVLAGSVGIGFRAADIAIAPNGQFALVVDGVGGNRMAIIDLIDFSTTVTYTMTTVSSGAGAVAIGPDSQTVIICDYFLQRIIYGAVDPASGLISEKTLPTGGYPINVAISPDGQTALAIGWFGSGGSTISIFRITSPGVVEPGINPTLGALPVNHQSIAFSPDGQRAYVVSVQWHPDKLSWLQVNGPGDVTLGGARVTDLLTDADAYSGFYGVDIVAVTPDGSYALVGNPSGLVYTPPGLSRNVAMVNLSDWSLTEIATDGLFPVGIAVFNQLQPPRDPEYVDPVFVDIKPGSLRNPLNLRSRGVLPVAILGTESLDVATIDPFTIALTCDGTGEGVLPILPIRWRYADVATPFEGEMADGYETGPDGYMDLTLKFKTQEVVEEIGEVSDGDEVFLTISGCFLDGAKFEGEDFVTILKKGKAKNEKNKEKKRGKKRGRGKK